MGRGWLPTQPQGILPQSSIPATSVGTGGDIPAPGPRTQRPGPQRSGRSSHTADPGLMQGPERRPSIRDPTWRWEPRSEAGGTQHPPQSGSSAQPRRPVGGAGTKGRDQGAPQAQSDLRRLQAAGSAPLRAFLLFSPAPQPCRPNREEPQRQLERHRKANAAGSPASVVPRYVNRPHAQLSLALLGAIGCRTAFWVM